MTGKPLRQRVGREVIKAALAPLLGWRRLKQPEPGFSVMVGVPWDLRHLLPVNLRFVARTDLRELRRVHVVFDRREREGAAELIDACRRDFPELPLSFRFYPPVSGHIVERVHVSTFYNSMNTVLALGECTTRYMILHDFDLYPLRPQYFTSIIRAMQERGLRFSGHELTRFDGLEDHDGIIGTWSLGIDAQWIRSSYRPIDAFHKVASVRGRMVNLDPYSWIQTRTAERGVAGEPVEGLFCHVQNLCSTYLRYLKGAPLNMVWRLHYLWYLESLAGRPESMLEATRAMLSASSADLRVGTHHWNFAETDYTCANVLQDETFAMEAAIFGEPRPEVRAFVGAYRTFLERYGVKGPAVAAVA